MSKSSQSMNLSDLSWQLDLIAKTNILSQDNHED